MTFKPSFADWRSLFSDLVPAHIARTVGWNTGFTGPARSSRAAGTRSRATHRTSRSSSPATRSTGEHRASSTSSSSRSSPTTSQEVPALQNNEVNLINPASVSLSIVQTADQVPDTTRRRCRVSSSSTSTSTRPTPTWPSSRSARRSPTATNRQSIITRTVGEIAKGITPLGNRMLVPNQKGYKGTSYAFRPVHSPRQPAEGSRLQEGLGRLLPARLARRRART